MHKLKLNKPHSHVLNVSNSFHVPHISTINNFTLRVAVIAFINADHGAVTLPRAPRKSQYNLHYHTPNTETPPKDRKQKKIQPRDYPSGPTADM